MEQAMSDRNQRPDRDGPVEGETIVAKQTPARGEPLRDDRVEDAGVSADEPIQYERTADAVPPRGDRVADVDPREPIRYDQDADVVPPRETESPVRAPLLATAMFLPVVIISVIALILIIWFLVL
jgi:hypothetical protein